MWTLFMVIFTLWIFTKFLLNVIEIFARGEEMIAHRQFVKNLHEDILDKIAKNPDEEE